jgi:hypothetical protein
MRHDARRSSSSGLNSPTHIGRQVAEPCPCGARQRSNHHVVARKTGQVPAEDRTKPPFDEVPHHRTPHCLRDDEPDAGSFTVGTWHQVHDKRRASCACASSDGPAEVGRPSHPMLRRKHQADQADSSERPLRRRAARIARPARVRIRRRKPWVLARRRLFGWNVRLVTTTPLTRGSRSTAQPWSGCRAHGSEHLGSGGTALADR